MCQLRYLVLLDTDKIKEYVFATNKMREIRGASAILEELNSEPTEHLAQRFEMVEKIFLGGGSGKLVFDNQNNAQHFCSELKKLYFSKTDGAASITAVCLERRVLNGQPESFQDWIYRGEKELRKAKDSKYHRFQPLTNPYFKICESTGMSPAETMGQGDRRPICQASYIKRRQEDEKDSVFFRKFKQFLENPENAALREKVKDNWTLLFNKQIKELLPKDLDDIGALSSGYVGLIYADGNRMGQRLAVKKSSAEYRDFSDNVKNGTQDAIFEALACHLRMNLKRNQKRFPFEILLLGGDDLIAVVPANKAIEIAIDFCKGFKAKTCGISISAGVVITHVNYPIHRMIEHAEDLLKSAKRLSNKLYRESEGKPEAEREVNAIDFMALKGALLQDVGEMRAGELSYHSDDHMGPEPNLKLYQRPYTTEKLGKLIDWIQKMKQSGFPHNKLKAMYEALYRGKMQAMMDYLLITSRLEKGPGKAREVMKAFWQKWDDGFDMFPWKKKTSNEYVTPFIDLIELYEFIDEK